MSNEADHVIVCGVDMLSEFTLAGFQSFFAISEAPCKPFDKNRTGINLGEGAATVILSSDKSTFKGTTMKCLGGSTANDANHISGPSRTGEGLYRSISKNIIRRKNQSHKKLIFFQLTEQGQPIMMRWKQ